MVGIMTSWGDRAAGLLQSATATGAIPSKMKQLRQLREVLLNRDPSLITEFAPRLAAELQADCASPVRKFLAELIGEIGLKDMELIPEMVPTLISFLKDETAAVARQAITTGTSLFRNVLEKVVIQGAYSSELDDSLKSCWAWMLKFKNSVLPIAFQSGIDGVRLLAVKFVEAMVLLYTPDPNVPSDPPHEVGDVLGFNITWVKGGHPMLNVGDLSMEATQSLRLLLDQLRPPKVRSLSNSIIMVLTNSLSAIAARRPSFYGRILPVLLTLDPASSVIKGVQVPGAHHALKSAFLTCWKCTHSSAEPWRPRLVEALKAMNADAAEDLNDVSGIISVSTEGLLSTKEHNSFLRPCEAYSDIGRKRHFVEDSTDLSEDDTISGKRIRPSVVFQVPAKETLQSRDNPVQNNHSLLGSLASTRDADSGPAQQLVGMFGALVAQGVKAAGSLEILTSSISPDLLAEVVMANLRYLPPTCPKAEEEEVREGLSVMQPTGNVSDNFSLSTAFPLIASLLNVQPVISHDIAETGHKYEVEKANRAETPFVSSSEKDSVTRISTSIHSSVSLIPPRTEPDTSAIPLYINDVQGLENKIPGLESTSSLDEMQESLGASHTSTGEMQGIEQEQAVSLGSTVPLDTSSSGCMTTYSSETFSPSIAVVDPSQAPSSSPGTSIQYVLPKMSVPNVILTDEQKDQLLKVAYLRILEAYKQVAVSGGSHIHFSLLAHLGIEFPLELDSWGLIQKHVLLDYSNHEGHELTLRVLFRLYREVEQDQDFLSSRTATSVYESFLLAVAEALRDTLPASDKSLGRLLGEVPYLSDGVLKLLECLCSPEGIEKNDKVFQNGDRVTQGLTAVWNLIMLRPSNRDRCLQIALESTVHHLEEVRKKAIRLVANKLFPMASISKKIEDFADEKLHSVINNTPMDILDGDGSISESQKDDDMERLSSDGQALASTSDNHATENAPSSSFSEAQRWMSLYFALCTKKHLLLVRIFAIYQKLPKAAKQAVHRQVPILVRTIGSSPVLLDIIADPPIGSENLLMQVLQTLIDAAVPPQNLIPSVKRLYNSKQKDVQVLIPVLPFLSKDEVLSIFPQFVNLPLDKFQGVLARILQESPQTSSALNPAEVLIAIHGIDSERDGVPLKKVMDACSACFEQRNIFTEQVLAKVLNQLVEQIPLPLLFMRTVIQAIGVYPALVDFVMEILSRLVSKQIWKYPKLWVGFLKCAIQTRPQSFSVLLKLPAVQLENALTKNPVLKPPLVEHANLPNIRSTLPRSTLVVLGLVNDSQASGQAQASQSQAADTSSSAADTATEVTEENAVVS